MAITRVRFFFQTELLRACSAECRGSDGGNRENLRVPSTKAPPRSPRGGVLLVAVSVPADAQRERERESAISTLFAKMECSNKRPDPPRVRRRPGVVTTQRVWRVTAKTLGLTIPESFLPRANEVIE